MGYGDKKIIALMIYSSYLINNKIHHSLCKDFRKSKLQAPLKGWSYYSVRLFRVPAPNQNSRANYLIDAAKVSTDQAKGQTIKLLTEMTHRGFILHYENFTCDQASQLSLNFTKDIKITKIF